MGNTFYFAWEAGWIQWWQEVLGERGIALLSHLSLFGESTFVVVVLGFLYLCYDKQKGADLARIVLSGMLFNAIIKNLFLRRRPYFDHETIRLYRVPEKGADIYDLDAQGYSFPSGHATCSAAVFGGLAHSKDTGRPVPSAIRRLLPYLAIAIPLLTGLSRTIVGAHYPTDVLSGWALGAAAVFLVPMLTQRLGEKKYDRLIIVIALFGILFCSSKDYYSNLGMYIGFALSQRFERHYVRFQNATCLLEVLLRLAGGGILYFGVNALLKAAGTAMSLTAGMPALLFRLIRYAIVAFILFGVYPLLFGHLFRGAQITNRQHGQDV